MGKTVDDLLAEMRAGPANVRFEDACRVATHFFGRPRSAGTSHFVWKMPWTGDPRVNLQNSGGKAKPYQVRQILRAVERLLEEKKP